MKIRLIAKIITIGILAVGIIDLIMAVFALLEKSYREFGGSNMEKIIQLSHRISNYGSYGLLKIAIGFVLLIIIKKHKVLEKELSEIIKMDD